MHAHIHIQSVKLAPDILLEGVVSGVERHLSLMDGRNKGIIRKNCHGNNVSKIARRSHISVAATKYGI